MRKGDNIHFKEQKLYQFVIEKYTAIKHSGYLLVFRIMINKFRYLELLTAMKYSSLKNRKTNTMPKNSR